MKYLITIAFLTLILLNSNAQKIEDIIHREINIHENDSSIKANVLLEGKQVKVSPCFQYYWYYNNSIKINQGDYKGRLLDGDYQVTTKDGNLITKGYLKKGVKVGVWKKWDAEGKLLSISKWKNGYKNGSQQKFENGYLIEQYYHKRSQLNGSYKKYKNLKLVEKANYKKGDLHGKQLIYDNDTLVSEKVFKKGKEIEPKIKKESQKLTELEQEEAEETQSEKKSWKFWQKKKEDEMESNKTSKIPTRKKKMKLGEDNTDKKNVEEKESKKSKKEKSKKNKDD